jgi:hypothetical protein
VALFGEHLRPAGERDTGTVLAELAERDRGVRDILAARRRLMVPLPEPPPPAEPEPEWQMNQLCWCCEQRRKCCPDPKCPELLICKECLSAPRKNREWEPPTSGVVHWLPTPLNEGSLTACGLDVYTHRLIQWRTSQNEATCLRCLASHVLSDGGGLENGMRRTR